METYSPYIMKNKSLLLKTSAFILLILSILTYTSCTRDFIEKELSLQLPSEAFNYQYAQQRGRLLDLKSAIPDNSRDAFSDHSATLGRVLFYDKVMSINNSVACASCHIQAFGFADGTQFSTGFANKKTPRNSMAIVNAIQNNKMFWDSRAESPYELSLMPVFNHLEMGMESDEMLVSKVSALSYYPELFQNAYGSEEVTKDKISLAITAFINSMFSKNSKWDQGLENNFSNFTAEENLGRELFNSPKFSCSSCHAADNFNSQQYYNHFSNVSGTANIGLDRVYADNGADRGSFKIPNLRNVAITGPYMHDGRFNTLEDVLNHYAHGVQDNDQLDPRFRNTNGSVKRIEMTSIERNALVSFLNTLTDQSFITDPKFSNPFR